MSDTSVPSGHIHEVAVLNLLSAKSAEEFKNITSISEVGVILVPEHLAGALMQIPMSEVGTIAPIPGGDNVNLQVGQIKLSGEALAAGDPERILVAVGQVFITSVVQSVGYKGIHLTGQLFATRGSEDALGSKLIHVNGQTFYLPADPRLFMGDESIGKEFLELLPEPAPLVIMGNLTIEADVTRDLMQSKINEIVLMGQLRVPKPLLPLAQVLTKEKMGEIKSYE